MNTFRKSLPVIILLISGCATGGWQMKIEPTLAANALVYDIKSEKSWTEKKLNISFGKYQVTDAKKGQKHIEKTRVWDEYQLIYMALGLNERQMINKTINASHSYNFKIGTETTWHAECVHIAEAQNEKLTKRISVENSWSLYTCNYTSADKKSWSLTIYKRNEDQLKIEISNNELLFKGYASKGQFVMSDGSIRKVWGAPEDAGYYWTHEERIVAATSVKEKIPKVWLDKRNSDPILNALAMASAGLQIYYKKIASVKSYSTASSRSTHRR